MITSEVQPRLYAYMGGIIRNEGGHLLEIGGMADHVHLLVQLTVIDKFSNLIRDMKAHSSGWVHRHFPNLKHFTWQEGYGSFSVSYSVLEKTKRYIQNQEQHHKTMTFEEEYIKYLKLHGVEYDERFVFG